MQTSPRGVAFLEKHEGVVLRAYRDVAGVWTIGAGLTKSSGVVTPRAGMVITRAQASALLAKALSRNYEPDVRHAMPGARQNEFDGGVSFHFNTGAIGRASWVRAWIKRDWLTVRSGLAAWCKAGGKTVRGLALRRQAEYELIRTGHYADGRDVRPAPRLDLASWAPATTSADVREVVRRQLLQLGYAAGSAPGEVTRAAATSFQKDHALSVDGVIGPATMATITRMMNARNRFAAAGVATIAPAAATAPVNDRLPGALGDDPWLLIVPGLLWFAWLTWTHRDAIAAVIQTRAPRVAAYLRSF